MLNVLKRLVDVGVPPDMNPEEAKYIQMGNLGALLMIAVMIPYMALCLINGWTLIFFEILAVIVLLLVTPVLNRRGLHLAALIYFGSLLNIYLTFVTIAMGRETLLQILIFFTAGGVVTLIPRKRTGLIVGALLSILVTYKIALVLERAYGPLYRLTGGQIADLRLYVEYSIFILIVVNAAIARFGAISAEDRLRREQCRSEGLLTRVREQDRQRTVFFQNISHELRTPLTLILGPIRDLLSGPGGRLTEGQRKRLQMMERNSSHLLRLTNQLLDLSKLDSGKMALNIREGDLPAFVGDLVQSFSGYAERKGIGLSLIDRSGGMKPCHDQEIIEKAVSNLLSNACKFTPQGGSVAVTLAPDDSGADFLISVKDTGPGIPPGDIGRIFDRFHQAGGPSARKHEGTGIGLSLVKELAQIHRGSVDVRSEPGGGSEFTLRIPADLKPPAEAAPEIPVEDTGFSYARLESSGLEYSLGPGTTRTMSPEDAGRPLVLVVEDNRDMRDYLKNGLEGRYRVLEAADGLEGLAAAREYQPHLIISDVMMPRMDGYEMCREIRSDERLRSTPVILLTARVAADSVVEGLDAGAVDYMTKPFSFEVLLAKTRAVLSRSEEQGRLAARDPLTGLYNRRVWSENAERELKRIGREGGCMSVIFIDIDNFKSVNDSFGHKTGDMVLVELSKAMTGELRSTDTVGRYGGEEMVICMPGATGANGAKTAGRILDVFRGMEIGEGRVRCTFSAGVAEASRDAGLASLDEYVIRADAAMYGAKKSGKAQVMAWHQELVPAGGNGRNTA
jgi:diguanylate cyclase (GGDEF)-like protein